MTFEETVRESIRKFYDNKAFTEYTKENQFKYTRDYFMSLEDAMSPKPTKRTRRARQYA